MNKCRETPPPAKPVIEEDTKPWVETDPDGGIYDIRIKY